MDSGGEHEAPAQPQANGSGGRKKKLMYRHTPQQIQELEAMFRVCPHPDDKQRGKMSRDLGLESRQIKFWFQNRRTLMKSQHEKADNCSLRAENDRIRGENIAMKEAVRRLACRHCGLNNGSANPYFDEQRLRMENARLKEEVDRVSNLTSKYLGRPIAHQHHLLLPKSVPQGGGAPPSFDPSPSIPYSLRQISDSDKPMLMDMASYAMDEVIQLLQLGEPLWVKSASNGAEVLELQAYQRKFPKPHQPKFSGTRTEASRDSATVTMSCRMLVDAFMTPSKWMELFPTIVSNATTIDVLPSGASGSSSAGSAILMYQELQILSPAVPTRELCVLRHCRRVDSSSWAIADVSVDYLLGNYVEACARKLPSGCLISEMANGCSKITWIEHVEIEEKNPIHILFQHLVTSGAAFEARRWVSNLRRTAERNAFSISAGIANDLGGGNGRSFV
ncbi:homeobox-leucine zipper protein ROC8-like [Zingiber officinale]|uniref:homeobox-leucine zipper protein ROC8-like n=1 Tax=Zingiber officinale TaxID=94328 RepID=UPI001C4BA326|nr:homeobox-leucine zipper protein ROC8-like [Zingiber officinale]